MSRFVLHPFERNQANIYLKKKGCASYTVFGRLSLHGIYEYQLSFAFRHGTLCSTNRIDPAEWAGRYQPE